VISIAGAIDESIGAAMGVQCTRPARTESHMGSKKMSIRSDRRGTAPPRRAAAAPVRGGAQVLPDFDVLSDVMEQVRLEATVYFSAELHAPWGIAVARRGRAPFYAITEGRCELVVGRRVLRVEAGDLLLLPNAAPHVARSGRDAVAVPFDDWVRAHPMDARGATVQAGGGAVTRVTGGFFSTDVARLNPLFTALPPVIYLRGSDPQVRRWLEPTLAFIHAEVAAREQGAATVLRRLADVLFIQAVRVHAQQQDGAASWLRGLADPRIARALTLLHARYMEPWSLDALARAAGLSRTLLAVRFKALVGESPMHYLSRWRITRAAGELRTGRDVLERVAERVGYPSAAQFSKAFRRVTGEAPGRWRRRRIAPPAPPGLAGG
jgi:AraC-like DNA-binding protein/mannose-6-phosphate isomerase-like protein (cupin superfamily)